MTVRLGQVLHQAKQALQHCDTAVVDAQLLLTAVLNKSLAYLVAHPEHMLTQQEQQAYQASIARRASGEPLAYIVGYKPFWRTNFVVNAAVLIPRPETELLVELSLRLGGSSHESKDVLELGTGSGAVAISIALERPNWQIYATDLALAALNVARNNGEVVGVNNLSYIAGSWFTPLRGLTFDLIISNPPYVASKELLEQGVSLSFEPYLALLAADDGYRELFVIIANARYYLREGGYLLLEHGAHQAAAVRSQFAAHGYRSIVTYKDLQGLERVTLAEK